MDPNANLKEQLKLAHRILSEFDNEKMNGFVLQDSERLAELVIALNEWLSAGGFKPEQWKEYIER